MVYSAGFVDGIVGAHNDGESAGKGVSIGISGGIGISKINVSEVRSISLSVGELERVSELRGIGNMFNIDVSDFELSNLGLSFDEDGNVVGFAADLMFVEKDALGNRVVHDTGITVSGTRSEDGESFSVQSTEYILGTKGKRMSDDRREE